MYIYGVLHLRSGVTSADRYVSEEGVSRWGTGWLFLGWKFASHPKLMILKTRVCRRAIAKVFRNFVGVCQTWTTKSPQSKQACSNLCLDKVVQLAGGGGQRWDTCFTYSPVLSLHETNTAPYCFPTERLVDCLLNKDLKNSAVFKEIAALKRSLCLKPIPHAEKVWLDKQSFVI